MIDRKPGAMLPIVLRAVRCQGCHVEFWPGEKGYSEHWIMWRCDQDGTARGVRVECHKCHRRTVDDDKGNGGLCDQQLDPGWVGNRALVAALSMLLHYCWPDSKDRGRIERIAEAMSFAHLCQAEAEPNGAAE